MTSYQKQKLEILKLKSELSKATQDLDTVIFKPESADAMMIVAFRKNARDTENVIWQGKPSYSSGKLEVKGE